MKSSENYAAAVSMLATKVHEAMLQKATIGNVDRIVVCNITVTCADDLQSIKNRFSQGMRRALFTDIDLVLAQYGVH